jgi:bifunctional DNA-binding transcriptional regulator/antitoxin component of YhaV-PrlF toxin-antitoxin module
VIVRILGEGQFEVPAETLEALNRVDEDIVEAVERDDEASFTQALEQLLSAVRDQGKPLPPDYLGSSELVLPARDATLAEVRALLSEEGLIPG